MLEQQRIDLYIGVIILKYIYNVAIVYKREIDIVKLEE